MISFAAALSFYPTMVCTLVVLYMACSILVHDYYHHQLLRLGFGSPPNGARSTLPTPYLTTGPGACSKTEHALFQLKPKYMATLDTQFQPTSLYSVVSSYLPRTPHGESDARTMDTRRLPMVRRGLEPCQLSYYTIYTLPICSLLPCKFTTPSFFLKKNPSLFHVSEVRDTRSNLLATT